VAEREADWRVVVADLKPAHPPGPAAGQERGESHDLKCPLARIQEAVVLVEVADLRGIDGAETADAYRRGRVPVVEGTLAAVAAA
jgi:hypothetical protein